MYDDLEGDILLLNPRDEYFTCIMGDFNARTGQLDDFVEVDESILDVHNSYYVFDEDVCVKNMLMSFKIPCQRICRDKGKLLMEINYYHCVNQTIFKFVTVQWDRTNISEIVQLLREV